jgi:hypothetical protein
MKSKKQILKFLFFAVIFSVMACKAPVGDIGPQGLAGATGDKGDKGATGDKGAFSGIVSAWTEIKPTQWKTTGTKSVFTITDATLTQTILDQGLILAYYRPLPEDESSAVISLADETNTYLFTFKTNVGTLDYELNFKSAQVVNPSLEDWNIKVRYIIVPPAKTGRLAQVNWKDYNEVKKILNLND